MCTSSFRNRVKCEWKLGESVEHEKTTSTRITNRVDTTRRVHGQTLGVLDRMCAVSQQIDVGFCNESLFVDSEASEQATQAPRDVL